MCISAKVATEEVVNSNILDFQNGIPEKISKCSGVGMADVNTKYSITTDDITIRDLFELLTKSQKQQTKAIKEEINKGRAEFIEKEKRN